MERGKDGEKLTAGPMFPRLHVNDTEKGGPRAPPRNKMALYEQLSIPSQRINPGDSRNSRNLHPRDSSSSSQGSRVERNRLFHHVSSSPVEKYNASQLEGGSLNAQVAQFEQRKKAGEEDDLRVPVFDTGKLARRIQSNRLIKHRYVNGNDPKRSGGSVVESRKEIVEQGEKRSRVCSSREQQMDSVSNSSTRQKIDGPLNESEPSTSDDCRDQPVSRSSGSGRLHSSNDCSRSMIETKDDGGHAGFESVRGSDNNDLAQPISGSRSMEDLSSRGVEMRGSQQIVSGDKSDDVSETSMVDSGSAMDISPDDVVGVIGQKRFWKARRAILNQQRAFGVQVFELHRLIKVQRLIAGSPHLLLEDTAYLAKPSSNGSTPKKLTLECAVKPVVQIKCKDDSGKLIHKFECSAENAVGRASQISVKNGSQPSNYGSYPGNQPQTPVPTYNNTNPWFFHQSPMHQWLVPVMTPSEGLVYKPYPGPGFAGTAWGGCGSFGSPPMTLAYGVTSPPPHYQGMGFLPGAPSGGQAYFPPYGLPVMNPAMSGSAVEQMNQFAEPGFHGQADPLSGEGANFNAQQQNSPNLAEKNGANSQIIKSKVPEIQGSRASSPIEKVQQDRGVSYATKGSNALPLFPAAKAAPQEVASQPHDTDQPTRVIRVVPHNPRSANESAARIFQSIQEERRHQDSA